MAFDTIIKGGRVVDGSGLPVRTADVGIKGGLISDIGRLSGVLRLAQTGFARSYALSMLAGAALVAAAMILAVRLW